MSSTPPGSSGHIRLDPDFLRQWEAAAKLMVTSFQALAETFSAGLAQLNAGLADLGEQAADEYFRVVKGDGTVVSRHTEDGTRVPAGLPCRVCGTIETDAGCPRCDRDDDPGYDDYLSDGHGGVL